MHREEDRQKNHLHCAPANPMSEHNVPEVLAGNYYSYYLIRMKSKIVFKGGAVTRNFSDRQHGVQTICC